MLRVVGFLAFLFVAPCFAGEWTAERIDYLKHGVVRIDAEVHAFIDGDGPGEVIGTGFLVDRKQGLFISNRHVSGHGPGQLELKFCDTHQTKIQAGVVYYDLIHDFSILKAKDPKEIPASAVELTLGSSLSLKNGDPLMAIGSNDGIDFSILKGKITDRHLLMGTGAMDQSATLQTDLGGVQGSSGSPLFDSEDHVVALQFGMKDKHQINFALRVEYLKNALEKLANGPLKRGTVGLFVELRTFDEIKRNYGISQETLDRLISQRPDLERLLTVERIHSRFHRATEAGTEIELGDILYSIDGILIGQDVIGFEKILDEHVGQKVTLKVLRHSKIISVQVLVKDLEKSKPNEFVTFFGGTFFNPTLRFRQIYGLDDEGVVLGYLNTPAGFKIGSPLGDDGNSRAIVIDQIGFNKITDLGSFVRAVAQLKEGDVFRVVYRNFNAQAVVHQYVTLRYDPKLGELKYFKKSPVDLEWESLSVEPFLALH